MITADRGEPRHGRPTFARARRSAALLPCGFSGAAARHLATRRTLQRRRPTDLSHRDVT
jgi:hypothetical protein